MIVFLFGLFGLVVGSFLNVVIFRYGARGMGSRSMCATCKKQLPWFDMVPVFSWFVLRGHCRYCKAPISIQYPIVEATTGILFAMIGVWAYPAFLYAWYVWPILIDYLAICALLVAIAAYDSRHKIIPDGWVWPFVGLALLSQFLTPLPNDFPLTLFLLAGPVAALPLFALWTVSKGTWMGFGDVKLSLGIGWLLGFPFGLIAVFFGFILGAVVSVPLLLWGKLLPGGSFGFTMKSEVPFGPFLIASTFIVWFAAVYNLPLPLVSL